jgi:hypothetical protein
MTKRLRRWVALSDDEDSLPYHLDEEGTLRPLSNIKNKSKSLLPSARKTPNRTTSSKSRSPLVN